MSGGPKHFVYVLRSHAQPWRWYTGLTSDPEHGVRAGDIGTVVGRHIVPGVSEEGYSVEFVALAGNTVAVTTRSASVLRPPTAADRPAAGALSAA